MKVKKQPNFKKIKDGINKKVYKALETSGTSTIAFLKKRIKKGVNAKGGRFRELKPETIKSKMRSKKKKGDLTMFEFSGDMLQSITHKTSQKNNSLKLYFDDADENKKAHYNIENHKRDFFELSDKEIKRIEDRISDSLINL